MEPVALQVPKVGSYTSAVARKPLKLEPPVTRTLPLLSSVAVWDSRSDAMEPVESQRGQAGSPVTAKLLVAVRLKALVTVAVMFMGVFAKTQAGAVQVMLLEEAPVTGVPSEPVVAAQEKDSAEPSGSLA